MQVAFIPVTGMIYCPCINVCPNLSVILPASYSSSLNLFVHVPVCMCVFVCVCQFVSLPLSASLSASVCRCKSLLCARLLIYQLLAVFVSTYFSPFRLFIQLFMYSPIIRLYVESIVSLPACLFVCLCEQLSVDLFIINCLSISSYCYSSAYFLARLSVCLSIYLSVCLSVCLSTCLLVYLSVSLSVCVSIYLSISLSVCLFICLSLCLCGYLSVYLSVYLCVYLSVCLSVCVAIYLSISLSVCLSVYLSVCLHMNESHFLSLFTLSTTSSFGEILFLFRRIESDAVHHSYLCTHPLLVLFFFQI